MAAVFLVKHLIPLVKFAAGVSLVSEPPLGRAADAQNYVKLLYAIGAEQVPKASGDKPYRCCGYRTCGLCDHTPNFCSCPKSPETL